MGRHRRDPTKRQGPQRSHTQPREVRRQKIEFVIGISYELNIEEAVSTVVKTLNQNGLRYRTLTRVVIVRKQQTQ